MSSSPLKSPPNNFLSSRPDPFLIGLAGIVWLAALAKGAQDLWTVTAIGGWLTLLLLAFLGYQQRSRRTLIFPFLTPISFIGIAFLVSSRYSMDVNTTHQELTSLSCLAAFYFLLVNQARVESARQSFIAYGGSSVFVVVLVALVQYLHSFQAGQGPSRLSVLQIVHSHWGASSTFTNSAVLAGFSLSWALIAWHDRRRGPYYRWLFLACLAILFFARSWWAFVSLGAGFTYYYSIQATNASVAHKRGPWLAGALTVGILLMTLLFKFGSMQNPHYLPDNRWGWWVAGIRMFLEHPWVGVGLGGYATAFPYFRHAPGLSTLYAHSFPVQLLCETGLCGSFAVILLIRSCLSRFRTDTVRSAEQGAYQATVVALLCFSLTSIYFDYFIGKLMFINAFAQTLHTEDWPGQAVSRRMLFVSVTALVFLIPCWYLPFRASQYRIEGIRFEEMGDDERAVLCYNKSLRLDPMQDQSNADLGRTYQRLYDRTHSPVDLARSQLYLEKAFRWKKDIHYVQEMTHPLQPLSPPSQAPTIRP